jgi:DNA-binding transcriptional LysR family regulator
MVKAEFHDARALSAAAAFADRSTGPSAELYCGLDQFSNGGGHTVACARSGCDRGLEEAPPAAERENATQSGISQHVAAVERSLGVTLFERTTGAVTPTPAGLRYYKRCVEAVGTLEHAAEEARSLAGQVTGDLRIGLMPTFTRAVLAPVLEDFVPRCPEVRLHIVEGYSGSLTDMVLDDELDFAVVPASRAPSG